MSFTSNLSKKRPIWRLVYDTAFKNHPCKTMTTCIEWSHDVVTWHGLAWAEVFFHHLVVLFCGHIALFGKCLKNAHMLLIFGVNSISSLSEIVVLDPTCWFVFWPIWFSLYFWLLFFIFSERSLLVWILWVIHTAIIWIFFTYSFDCSCRRDCGCGRRGASNWLLGVTVSAIQNEHPVFQASLSDWKQTSVAMVTYFKHYRNKFGANVVFNLTVQRLLCNL